MALREQCAALRIDAGGEQLGRGDVGALAQRCRVVLDRDGVQVGDEVERLEVVLQGDPLLERAEVVAEVIRVGGRLGAGQHSGTTISGHGRHSASHPARRRVGA
jgi:hypothetical protein